MSDSEMVERCARAIQRADFAAFEETKIPWENIGPHGQEAYRRQARAVFEAMREPTEHMKDMGARQLPDYDPSVDDSQMCWQAMIDAALGQKESAG